jgi:protein-tyrosine-phosphatase
MAKRFDILIVCTGNICRSPMAEGMLKRYLPEDLQSVVTIGSAGTHALDGRPAEPNAVTVMKAFGIDISRHRAHMVESDAIAGADLILVMETLQEIHIRHFLPAEKNTVRLMGDFGGDLVVGEIADPYGGNLQTYRDCATSLRGCAEGVIRHLRRSLSA